MKKLEELISYMQIYEDNIDIQKAQTAHRMRLVEAFDIQAGDKILEVGSGQGDTTAVLADTVTDSGHVHAVDIASADYGAPLTLKEATDYISKSAIGKQITFSFETDVTDRNFTGEYDVAILSHSLFYFSNEETLLRLLTKLKKIAHRICVADWDLDIQSPAQIAHAQAILIQVLFAEYKQSDANIQMAVTRANTEHLLINSGWKITQSSSVDASDLDDGKWEVAYSNSLSLSELEPGFSSAQKLMRDVGSFGDIKSLNSFVILAE